MTVSVTLKPSASNVTSQRQLLKGNDMLLQIVIGWLIGTYFSVALMFFMFCWLLLLDTVTIGLVARSLIWPYYFCQFLFGDDNEPQDPYTF